VSAANKSGTIGLETSGRELLAQRPGTRPVSAANKSGTIGLETSGRELLAQSPRGVVVVNLSDRLDVVGFEANLNAGGIDQTWMLGSHRV